MRFLLRLFSFAWISCTILLGTLPQAHAAPLTTSQSSSYSVLGPPTISVSLINQVLAAYSSPAAGKGQALYDAGVRYGIDPAFALAFFMHESSFGTTGVARDTLSLGNLRCIPTTGCWNGYAWFPNWEAGFSAWYALIHDVYVNSWGLTTVPQIIPRYAPSSDNNDEAAYVSTVENAVDTWRGQQIVVQGTTPSQQDPAPETATPSSTPAAAPVPPGPGQTRLLGSPTLSADFIEQTLTTFHSPAQGQGQLIYDEGVKHGIDPAFALAFFMRESTFGTVGLARATHALGTLPTSTSSECHCQDFHGYRRYDTWEDGIKDWYREMQSQYVTQRGLSTVEQIAPLYLNTQNAETIRAFVWAVEHRVDLWHQEAQASQSNSSTDTPFQATPVAASTPQE